MSLQIQFEEHRCVLKGSSLEALNATLEAETGTPPVSAFDGDFAENGGEAILRKVGSKVLRFERRLLDSSTSTADRALFQMKLQVATVMLPKPMAVVPKLPIMLGDGSTLVGYTMDFVPELRLLKERISDARMATEILLQLHSFICSCHDREVILGELNPRNFGVSGGKFFAIDTLSFGFPNFVCDTVYRPTVDPLLVCQDEDVPDHDERAWALQRPYTKLSDWYSFASIALELLVGAGPWEGSHRLAKECPELRRLRVRAVRHLSLFDPSIELRQSDLIRVPEALDELLYDYLYKVLNGDYRGQFPKQLLSELQWKKCSACGLEVAASVCPCGQVLRGA